MHFQELLEVSIIQQLHNKPLKDNDAIRVYHGTSNLETVVAAVKYGLTGSSYANRRYSYEGNNNPRGLFVTPDLSTAKDFGSYIIEFHARVKDLEAPVWPGGTFTAQGQMSGIFNSNDEREQERLKQRMRWSDSEYDFVRDSDRPELAALLLVSGERQALFTGDLNRNSIRAIWVSSDPSRVGQTYRRMSVKDFIDLNDREAVPDQFDVRRGADKSVDLMRHAKRKLISPRDNVTGEEFITIMNKRYGHINRAEMIKIIKANPTMIKDYVWSDRQENAIRADIMRM